MDGYNLDQETQEARYQDIIKYFNPIPVVNVIREESTIAAIAFPADSVHFVYIDANHCYEATKIDCHVWWRTVRSGGIMAGHDYYNSGQHFEVKKAVDEFAQSRGLTVLSTTRKNSRPSAVYGESWEGPSWAIRKI